MSEKQQQVSQVTAEQYMSKLKNEIGLDYSEVELTTLKQTIAKSLDWPDFTVFLSLSKANNLNPFKKEIWAYKDSRKNLVCFAGRDGFQTLAFRNPNYAGMQSVAIYEQDNYEIKPFNEDKGTIITHSITQLDKSKRGRLLGAAAVGFLRDQRPYVSIVMFDDYNRGGGTYKNAWDTHPEAMIIKVAETNMFKKIAGSTGLQSEYDFDVKGGVAIPVDTSSPNKHHASDATFTPIEDVTEDEASKIKEERLSLANQMVAIFDKYPDDEDMQNFRAMCTDKMHAKEFDIAFAKNTLKDVLAREEQIKSEETQGDEG